MAVAVETGDLKELLRRSDCEPLRDVDLDGFRTFGGCSRTALVWADGTGLLSTATCELGSYSSSASITPSRSRMECTLGLPFSSSTGDPSQG